MEILRTPEERFEGLEDWPFAPHHSTIDDPDFGPLRIAHAEAGPADGPVVLCLHGEPSWSYLYRKMLPPLAAAGFRAVAPDLVGFGRSDKPAAREAYTYSNHVRWLTLWFDAQAIGEVTLFCQDWGGLLGLRLVAARPDRFARIVAANTFLPTGDQPASEAFFAWQAYSQRVPEFDCGWIVNGGTARGISEAARAAYNAPFPEERFKAGPRAFPVLVPTSPDMDGAADNRAAWKVLEAWEKPFLTLFGDSDPVTAGGDKAFQARVPGASGQPHRLMERAGHFLQEDVGPELAEAIIGWSGNA
jgi:haloalkane dehalogenase